MRCARAHHSPKKIQSSRFPRSIPTARTRSRPARSTRRQSFDPSRFGACHQSRYDRSSRVGFGMDPRVIPLPENAIRPIQCRRRDRVSEHFELLRVGGGFAACRKREPQNTHPPLHNTPFCTSWSYRFGLHRFAFVGPACIFIVCKQIAVLIRQRWNPRRETLAEFPEPSFGIRERCVGNPVPLGAFPLRSLVEETLNQRAREFGLSAGDDERRERDTPRPDSQRRGIASPCLHRRIMLLCRHAAGYPPESRGARVTKKSPSNPVGRERLWGGGKRESQSRTPAPARDTPPPHTRRERTSTTPRATSPG